MTRNVWWMLTVVGLLLTGAASAQSKVAPADPKAAPAADTPNLPKLSGFVQGRFEWHEDSQDGLKDGGKPGTTTQFGVRRGRIKAAHDTDLSQFVLSIDATPKGVSLKDAEATFIEPWTGVGLRLTVGQFKIPFGYEITESDDLMLMPERSRVVRALFPGERDRGLRLAGKYEMLRFSFAVMNGNGIEDPLYGPSDQSSDKDVSGRIGFDSGFVSGGMSGYFGNATKTTVGDDVTPTTYEEFDKRRLGIDAQMAAQFVEVGKTSAKLELIYGSESGNEVFGYYMQFAQAIYEVSPFARFDVYSADLADSDATQTLAGGVEWMASKNLRLTAVYEHPWISASGTTNPGPQAFTAQMQAMF